MLLIETRLRRVEGFCPAKVECRRGGTGRFIHPRRAISFAS
jgi:hypothetical protein